MSLLLRLEDVRQMDTETNATQGTPREQPQGQLRAVIDRVRSEIGGEIDSELTRQILADLSAADRQNLRLLR
jgi:hypothetical protein